MARRVDESRSGKDSGRILRFELGNLGDHKLLVGGDKGSQVKDFARAQGFWRDFLEAKRHGKTK